MASTRTRFRQTRKPQHINVENIICTYQQKFKQASRVRFPVLTKELFLKTFPTEITDRQPDDDKPIDPNDLLKFTAHLGTGRLGKTTLMLRKDFTKYACSTVPKKDQKLSVAMIKMDASKVEYVDAVRAAEPYILVDPRPSPFVSRILLAFRSELPTFKTHYYMLCEYWQGESSLCKEIQKRGRLLEKDARFFFMELIDALLFIHQYGKILRRLCICNALLNPFGHIKLAPYSLCDQNLDCGQASNMLVKNCGDQFFASPEIVFGVDVQEGADWWSMGVILYNMITGSLPFTGRTLSELGKAITEGDLYFPENLTPEATTLIRNFMHKDPRRRLGCGPDGEIEIMKHPFFKGAPWAELRSLGKAPFIPNER